MKKIKYLLIAVLCMIFMPIITYAKNNEPINVYMFKSSTCPHCAAALEFFEGLKEDSEYGKYFNLFPFETNGSTSDVKANIELAQKVSEHFGNEFSGVPLIVIGDEYFEGYASSMDDEIRENIKKFYEKDTLVDVVADLQNGNVIEEDSNFDTLITILIVAVLIGGIVYFVYLARKNSNMDDESEDAIEEKEEDVDEKTMEKEETIKNKTVKTKNNKKKTASQSRTKK